MSAGSIAAVVVTYDRPELLRRAVMALHRQSRRLDDIIVVDNGRTHDAERLFSRTFQGVTYLRMSENLGPAGGFAAGMQYAHERGHTWIWLFNDDSEPARGALAACLRAVETSGVAPIGMLCPLGQSDEDSEQIVTAITWHGRPIPLAPRTTSAGITEVDGVTFNGALVSRAAIDSIGYPRADYFMMFEEWEYCLRMREAGFRNWLVPSTSVFNRAEGARDSGSIWRGYYQTRNHLAMAIDRKSPREVFWWGVRQLKFALATLLYHDRKMERWRLRLHGAWDAVRGNMGRPIDPFEYVKRLRRQADGD